MSDANTFGPSNGAGQAAVKDEAVSAAGAPLSVARANAPVRFETLPFVPRLFLSNGHLQTVAGIFLSRTNTLPPPVPELVEVSPASESQIASGVLCECHWHPAGVRAKRPTVVLVHGLEGSSESQYVVGNANKMWRAGANVIRMNMRNCGDTERLSPTLYHSGMSSDVEVVMRHFIARERLESVALVGYSMGGNLVLKLAGELGADAPSQLRSVVAVSPAIDLGPTADALHRPANRLYERRFLRSLIKRFLSQGESLPARVRSQARRRHPLAARVRRAHHGALLRLCVGGRLLQPRLRGARRGPHPRACAGASTRSTIPSSPSRRRRWPRSSPTRSSASSNPSAAATAPSSPSPTTPAVTTATGPRPRCSASSSPTPEARPTHYFLPRNGISIDRQSARA